MVPYCDGFIDRKWQTTMAKRQEEAARIENQQQEAAAERKRYETTVSWSEIEMEACDEVNKDKPEEETEYRPETPDQSGKRKKGAMWKLRCQQTIICLTNGHI